MPIHGYTTAAAAFEAALQRTRIALTFGSHPAQASFDALRAVFPVAFRIAGRRIADYVQLYRSMHPLDDAAPYGEAFPDLLEIMQSEDLPFLADLARLEWLVYRARRAAQAPVLDAAALHAIPAQDFERTRLELHPSCGLLHTDYGISDMWARYRPEDDTGEVKMETDGMQTFMLVHRPQTKVIVSVIDEGEYAFLEALANGQTLGAAFERAHKARPDFLPALALRNAAARGVISAIGA